MKIPSKRGWLNAACRDPRLEPRHFRVAAAIWARSDGKWRAQVNPAHLSAQTGLGQSECAQAVRRLTSAGYLRLMEGGQFRAVLIMPDHLPAKQRAPALSPVAADAVIAPSIGNKCLPLLRAVKDLASETSAGRFIPWRQVVKEMGVEPPRAGESGQERLRRLDAARKRFARLRAACLDAGAIEIDQARGVRLTAEGEFAVAPVAV